MWKGFYDTIEKAKLQAQTLANLEGCEYFVFDLSDSTEIFRAFPPRVLDR
jgi:hypothetical protein